MPERPGRRLTWTAYGLMLGQGFTVFSVGYITPYVQSELHAPAWASSAPNDAMAVGFLASAAIVPAVLRLAGPVNAARAWALAMGAAALLMASAASMVTVVASAFVIGVAGAGAIVHTASAIGARANGMYMVRSTVWSMTGGVVGPLALWAATQTTGWNTGMVAIVPVALLIAATVPASPGSVVAFDLRRSTSRAGRAATTALGRPYWTAWSYLVLTVGTEFAFVAWGAQVMVARTGIILADATALASLFVGGELLARVAWGAWFGARVDRVRTLRGMTLVALLGALVLWLAPTPAVAAVGFLLGGLGIALTFPVTSSLAMVYAAHAPVHASSRLNLASGIAIMGSPFVLGVATTAVGVTPAWIVTLALLGAAALIVLRLPRPAADAVEAAAVPAVPAVAAVAAAGSSGADAVLDSRAQGR